MQNVLDDLQLLLDSAVFARIITVMFALHLGIFLGMALGEEKAKTSKPRDRIA
jgi:hypothetical protein